MSVCEDAPCCGCCGHTVWAAEAQSEAEWAMEAHYDRDNEEEPDYESGPEADLIDCPWCHEQTEPDMQCWNCDEFVSSEPRPSSDEL